MIRLTVVSPEEWRTWRDLRLAALREAPYAFESTLEEWTGDGDTEQRWRRRLSEVPFNVVAALAGVSAGMVSATHPDDSGRTMLISMWVAPFARGRGAGDALVASVVNWARECGLQGVVLSVRVTNAHAAALYRRHGFRSERLVTGSNQVHDEIEMTLAL